VKRAPHAYLAQFFGLWDVMHRKHGWPAPWGWWPPTLTEAELSGVRQYVIRKPRRIGASTIIAPLTAVCEALHGGHDVPPNDIGYFNFFSVKRDEAAKRLRGIATVLDAIGVRHKPTADVIELLDYPIAFKVQAASFRTAVGDTSIGVWCDEVSRWTDAESGANPAREVLASVRPTIATMPNAKIWLVSSPLSNDDAHARAFEEGNTNAQRVFQCSGTWLANPRITEADTHDLEPNEQLWLREWCGQPTDGVTAHWFGETALQLSINRAPPQPIFRSIKYLIAADPAFAVDRFGWAVVSSQALWDADAARDSRANRLTIVHEVGAWKPDRTPREMWRRLNEEVCRRYRQDKVLSDQHHGESSRELARDVGLRLQIMPWTGGDDEASKTQRYKRVRTAMLEGNFRLPNDESLIKEVRRLRGTLLAGGGERIEVPRNADGHGDRIAAIVMAASDALEKMPQIVPELWTEAEFHQRYIAWCARGDFSWGALYGGHPIFAGPNGTTTWPDFKQRYQPLRAA
jgi:hypothetical protein